LQALNGIGCRHHIRIIAWGYNIVSESDQKEAMLKLEAAQTTIERQAEQKLPGRMDSFMESVEIKGDTKKAKGKRKTKARAVSATNRPETKIA
jgi:hypothetical protein